MKARLRRKGQQHGLRHDASRVSIDARAPRRLHDPADLSAGAALYGAGAARWAAALLAVNEYYLAVSARATAHAPYLFLVAAAVYAFSRFLDVQRRVYLYAAGASAGLAFYCKEHSVLLLPVFLLVLSWGRFSDSAVGVRRTDGTARTRGPMGIESALVSPPPAGDPARRAPSVDEALVDHDSPEGDTAETSSAAAIAARPVADLVLPLGTIASAARLAYPGPHAYR